MKHVVTYNWLLIFFLLSSNFLIAQSSPLAIKINQTKAKNNTFAKVNLFEHEDDLTEFKKTTDALADGLLLTLSPTILKSINKNKPQNFTLLIPTGNRSQEVMEIDLVRHQNLTDDFSVLTSSSNGQPVAYTPGLHYRGIVNGAKKSLAAISIFNNEVIGVISTSEHGNMVLGKTGDRANQYIFFKESDLLDDHNFECGTDDPALEHKKLKKLRDIANGSNITRSPGDCVNVYLECEYDMFLEKGSVNGTVNFMTGLFNAVATLYQNENITTKVSQIFVWDTPDSYPTGSTTNALFSFRSARPNYNGDLAHLVSRGEPAGGGVAWVNALCTNYGYAYSYIRSNYNNVPTYSWSVTVIAHEMGHNLGSPHTHACAWNGNNTAIDGCGPAVGANEGCNGPIPSQGTIMSYCHLVSGVGIDFNEGFGQQPGDRIRNGIDVAGCLSPCGDSGGGGGTPCSLSVSVNTQDASNGNDGKATASPTGGTSPYNYTWNNGGSTSSIIGLSPGLYAVTVTDAAGCTAAGSAIVNDASTPPCNLSISVNSTDATNGNNGTASVTPSNGTAPYNYIWNNGATSSNLVGLVPGEYSVTVTDGAGCIAQGSTTVNDASSPPCNLAVTVNTDDATNGNNGTASAVVSNGTSLYQYAWNTGATTASITDLGVGEYMVTITDGAGCTASGSGVVEDLNSGNCNDHDINLNLALDNYPTETSWEIVDANGVVVGTSENYTPRQNNTSVSRDFCLSDGCYDFNIFDTYGDGICCDYGEGSYTLTDSDGNVLAAGGEFNSLETINFCLGDDNGGGGGGGNDECATVIADDDFESGWGIWNDGGTHCRRSPADQNFALGVYCIRLRDNTSSSVMSTDNLNLAGYEKVVVDFSFYAVSMDNVNEDFWFQVSTDGGASYVTLATWAQGIDFNNNTRYFQSLTLVGDFGNNFKFRFRCDASSTADWVFLDEIKISACTAPNEFQTNEITLIENISTSESPQIPESAINDPEVNTLSLFPNPVKTELTVITHSISDTPVLISVFDLTGQLVVEASANGGSTTTSIDVEELNSGAYFVRMMTDGKIITKRFVVIR